MAQYPNNQMNRQLPLAIQLNDEATLSDFIWGQNAWLKQPLQSALHALGERFFYLWGAAGTGKSHLLQACCQTIETSESAIYLPLAMLKNSGPQVLEGIDEQPLICIDDLDAIATYPLWEEALFHLYNRVRDNDHSRLILSGKQAPSAMPISLADLRSRLNSGLVIQLHELNDDNKIKALKRRAQQRGFELSTSVGRFLMNRSTRNMHDLNALLDRLDEASLIAQRKITIPFVKSTLGL